MSTPPRITARQSSFPRSHLAPVAVLAAAVSASAAGPVLTVDAALDRAPISPLIYGINYANPSLAAELRLPLNRWGGNAVTRYNWRLDVQNRAGDYYFENIPNPVADPAALPSGSSSDQFVAVNNTTGTGSLITVPMIGWTPRDRTIRWGFSVGLYGAQQRTDPFRPDAGNGVRPGGLNITGNNPLDTSTAIGPDFVTQWVQHLVGRFGAASAGGVRFYGLDNEPDLWSYTHRDVHPAALRYDDYRSLTIAYAQAVRAADPGAKVLGPDSWGWSGYFFSPADVAMNLYPGPDQAAHGGRPLVEWYLDQLHDYETSTGVRLLDYLDLHYYPQSGVALVAAGGTPQQDLRLRSTRSLWDPAYHDESWINDNVNLIPRMRTWVAQHYPGTLLALTEYNWGGWESINGALAQADVLGIFGREGLDMAALWADPPPTQPVSYAFRLYRNYDSAGNAFGGTRIRAVSADQAGVSIYAAERPDGRLTIMLINKTGVAQTCALTIFHAPICAPAEVYTYGPALLTSIQPQPAQALAPAGTPTSIAVPPNTIKLLVVPVSRADFNHSGAATVQDIFDFLGAYFGGDREGDFNTSGSISVQDVFDFLAAYFTGCP